MNTTKENALQFLMSQKGGVVSTVKDNQPHSAFVFYDADEDFSVYFGTVKSSKKHLNIQANNKVAFVVQTIKPAKTIQIQGEATEVVNKEVLKNALANYVDIVTEQFKDSSPVAKMGDSELILYKIKPNWIRWSDYTDSGKDTSSTILLGDNK